MLSLRSRKRRHSETLSVPEASKVVDEASSEDESDEELDTEDEEAIAKSVREEFFEGLDQLGHTARRKMSLIGEVDQNVTALTETIKSQLRLYYDIRRGSDIHSQAPATDSSTQVDKSSAAPMKSSDIIPRIACNMDEWVRSGEEKVNLAQTMQEAIERHIRLIDHAISEQENAISSQSSSGLYLPPIVMPDKWIRAQHTAVSPMSDDETPETEIIDATAAPLNQKALTSGRSGKAAQNEAPTLKFKLTLPVPQSADPNEPRYCICNEVSYGEMIGCDNMNCKIEWFHIRCVGLDEAPTSVKWYCNDCKGGRIFGGVNVNRKTNKKKRRVNEAYRA